MSKPILYLDLEVQSALFSDNPQQAVTDLIKRYAAQMASDLRELPIYRPTADLNYSPVLCRVEDFEDIASEPVYLVRDVERILGQWVKS